MLVPLFRSDRILTLNWMSLSNNKIICVVRENRLFHYNNTTNWHSIDALWKLEEVESLGFHCQAPYKHSVIQKMVLEQEDFYRHAYGNVEWATVPVCVFCVSAECHFLKFAMFSDILALRKNATRKQELNKRINNFSLKIHAILELSVSAMSL